VVPRLRIFLSSPADVSRERLRTHLVIRRLAAEYRRYFSIEPSLWEYEPMLASRHFQDAIELPSSCDIVILTVWSRLGTPLPEKTSVREYRGIDGRAPVTGTEWEFEEALKANRATGGKGPPELLAYRRMGRVVTVLDDPALHAEAVQQFEALERFWRRWFVGDTGFLAGFATYRDPESFERKLEADLRILIERRIRDTQANPAAAVWLKSSPFRGLRAYDFDDAPVFFGRHGETGDGLTRLLDAAERGTAFLVVTGPSGSGKSSLARAGLLPSLLAPKTVAGVGLWRRAIMRPADAGGDPFLALARALTPDSPASGEGLPELLGRHMKTAELATNLAAGGDPAFLLARTLRDLAAAERTRLGLLPHEEARLVLLIDQLEELTTRPEIAPGQRSRFVRTVAALARSGVVWVIATVRSDLWHLLEQISELRELAEAGARLTLAAPDAAQLLEIIRKPAQAAGLSFDIEQGSELSLDALLAREAEAQPGVLPLLSVVLDELYERDVATGQNSVLTAASYRALGGLHAAIGRRAESRLQDIQKTDPLAAAALPRVLRSLVTVTTPAEAATTRSAALTAFPEGSPERRLVEALTGPDTRLLTAEDRGQGPAVRLAHEALIANWPRAKSIVADSASLIRLRDDIDAQRRRWEAAGRRPELLLAAGLPLTEARELTKKLGPELPPELLAFIKASRRRVHGYLQLAAAAGVIVLLSAGYWTWYWDQHLRTKTQYCANYGERWGVPYCIGELDGATQAARQRSYRFRIRGGRVLELARVNGSGSPIVFSDNLFKQEAWISDVALWQFTYLSDVLGTRPLLASVYMKNPAGLTLRQVSYRYSDDRQQAIARFEGGFGGDEGQTGAGSRLGLAANNTSEETQRSTIHRHRLSFDAQGQLVRREFLPATGDRTVADALGSHGRAYDYNAAGLPIRMRNLDSQSNTLVDKWGNAEQRFAYDRRGDLVAGQWLDRDGHLHANEQNFARFVWTLDSAGNLVDERLYTAAGSLTARTDLGVTHSTQKFDGRGNNIDERFFDSGGHPVISLGSGVAGQTHRYDARGNVLDVSFIGLKGELILRKDSGVARITYQYDKYGNTLEEAYFGTDGRPILSKGNGAAGTVYRYDEHGNDVEESYFGVDRKPTLSKSRYARHTMRYKSGGNMVDEEYFGVDGRPIAIKEGFARVTYSYDDSGNRTESAYYGVDGKPVANSDGVARVLVVYDERGNKSESENLDVDGRPTADKDGYVHKKYRYDDRGNQVEWENLDADGRLLANSEGLARETFSYDKRGNRVEVSNFDVNGRLAADREGQVHLTYQYDERGNRIEWANHGPDGRALADNDGVARTTYVYDGRGNKVEEDYFGVDGLRAPDHLGIGGQRFKYDAHDNRIRQDALGTDGRPVLVRIAGFASFAYSYDQRGNKTEERYLGVDGGLVRSAVLGYARKVQAYDERDNLVEEKYFDTDGEPMSSSGTARRTWRYDDRGNRVETRFFGVDDRPLQRLALIISEYDAQDRLVAESGKDSSGKPAMFRQDGIDVMQMRYLYGFGSEQIDQIYLDENGARIPVAVECTKADPGSAAARIGLAPGDWVLMYDGEAVLSTPQLLFMAAHAAPGSHTLTVRRGGVTLPPLDVPGGKLDLDIKDVPAARPGAGAPRTPPRNGRSRRR
jgi:hypothetical protein